MTSFLQPPPGRHAGLLRRVLWAGLIAVYLVPVVGSQVSDGMAWSPADFVVAAAALILVGVAGEVALRITPNAFYRAGAGVATLTAFLIVWIGGAVGIIGSDNDVRNLPYLVMLTVTLVSALVVRLRAAALVRVVIATAVAQAAIGTTALVAGWGTASASWPWDVIGLTAVFTALWLTSAWLFRQAAASTPRHLPR